MTYELRKQIKTFTLPFTGILKWKGKVKVIKWKVYFFHLLYKRTAFIKNHNKQTNKQNSTQEMKCFSRKTNLIYQRNLKLRCTLARLQDVTELIKLRHWSKWFSVPLHRSVLCTFAAQCEPQIAKLACSIRIGNSWWPSRFELLE